MKKEQKEINTPCTRDVYISSDNVEFTNACDCFDHEVSIGKWHRKFVNNNCYYLLNSLKEFNEFNKSMIEVSMQNILERYNEFCNFNVCHITYRVYDRNKFYAQTRPSKFPCYINVHLNNDTYNPSVEYTTLSAALEKYQDLLCEQKNEVKKLENLITDVQDILTQLNQK